MSLGFRFFIGNGTMPVFKQRVWLISRRFLKSKTANFSVFVVFFRGNQININMNFREI